MIFILKIQTSMPRKSIVLNRDGILAHGNSSRKTTIFLRIPRGNAIDTLQVFCRKMSSDGALV